MAVETSRDPGAFSAFERAGWNARICRYDTAFGAISRHTVEPMLEAAGIGPGMQVMDLCCGPGMLSAGALKRGASTVGVDFSEAAITLASILVTEGRFRHGDAQALALPDACFDAAVCGYGLMHLPDPAAGLREVLRVLRPGGRAAFSVWDAAGVGFTLVYEAVRARGSMNLPLPHGPDFFQLGSPERMCAALDEVGFVATSAYSLHQEWAVANADRYIDAILGGTVRAAAVLKAQSAEALADIRDYIEESLRRLPGAGSNTLVPMPAVIGSGQRPI